MTSRRRSADPHERTRSGGHYCEDNLDGLGGAVTCYQPTAHQNLLACGRALAGDGGWALLPSWWGWGPIPALCDIGANCVPGCAGGRPPHRLRRKSEEKLP